MKDIENMKKISKILALQVLHGDFITLEFLQALK